MSAKVAGAMVPSGRTVKNLERSFTARVIPWRTRESAWTSVTKPAMKAPLGGVCAKAVSPRDRAAAMACENTEAEGHDLLLRAVSKASMPDRQEGGGAV